MLFKLIALLTCCFFITPAHADDWNKHLDRNWSVAKIASEGRAEIALYRIREIIQRKSRVGNMTIITEPLAGTSGYWQQQTLQTLAMGVSTLQRQSTLVMDAGNFKAARLSYDSQEWGKNIWKLLDLGVLPGAKSELLQIGSGREVTKNQSINGNADLLKNAVIYESLPLFLRAFDAAKGMVDFNLMEPLAGELAQTPRTGMAHLVFLAPTTMEMQGKSYKVQPITLSHFLGEETLWFEISEGRALVKWQRYNGSEYLLRKTQTLDYWNHTQDLDVGLLD